MQKILADPECPECAAPVPIDAAARVNEIAECPDCGIELEITSLAPVALGRAPEVEEDWGE